MKRLIALVLAGLMVLGGGCLAAKWAEGCSPSKPYSQSISVNLSETMGYVVLFPAEKLSAVHFCDVLEMYLPREDLAVGEGLVHVYENVEGEDAPVEFCTVDFANPDSRQIRSMNDQELSDLMWGGGTCVEIYLPKSLEFGDRTHSYYVLMDAGCFTAADGKLSSLQITSDKAWHPAVKGDYGISGMYYIDAELPSDEEEEEEVDLSKLSGITDVVPEPEADAAEADEKAEGDAKDAEAGDDAAEKAGETEEAEKPTAEDKADAGDKAGAEDDKAESEEADEAEDEEAAEVGPAQYVVKPDPGDKLFFDLVIGGDAKAAVLYSENGSVEFNEIEYTQSGRVEGTVLGEEVQWGIAFYDENDYIFDSYEIGR